MTGYDGYSELGDGGLGRDGSRFSPELVPGLSSVVAASTSYYDTLALLANGTVEGVGHERTRPARRRHHRTAADARADPGFVRSDGGRRRLRTQPRAAREWHGRGLGVRSSTATGPREERLTPEPIPGLSEVVAISAGCEDSFALLANGSVEAWGANRHGELGDGMTKPQKAPEPIPGLSEVVAISGGCSYTLALLANGTVEGWGAKEHGPRGHRTFEEQLTPVPVPGLSNVVAISAGGAFGLALLANGTVEGWGYNEYGELGDGSTEEQLTPVQIPGLSEVAAVSAGADFGLALLGGRGGPRLGLQPLRRTRRPDLVRAAVQRRT